MPATRNGFLSGAGGTTPYGKHVHHTGGAVVALLGERADHDVADDVWDILPQQVAILDPQTLQIREQAPAPPDAVEVLGYDQDGW
ncbi:hypothetical protein K1W54_14370 [Micromonospora sp. CPCC 205371]|nr:hypothetical protein [Micromonospora sp. CPCC 205371]